MLTNAGAATNLPLKGYSISEILIFGLKLQEKRISHGKKNKNKQKNLPRKRHGKDTEISRSRDTEGRKSRSRDTEIRTSRCISHGITRKEGRRITTEGKCAGRRKTGPPHTRR
jgi:hypothetical protein